MSRSRATPWRPTREQIAAAAGATVLDVMAPDLRVLFVGINPGLYSGAVRHLFARPGNRFWKALALSGFTHRVLSPFEERDLLERGIGITNLVERATASAAELEPHELRTGAGRLERKVRRQKPLVVAFLGLSAYRIALERPRAVPGRLPELFGGTPAWLLPNPSGLNAHHQLDDLGREFRRLREAVLSSGPSRA